ncbi:hypothetical protein BHE74_00010372 [Ensete ventricosum]|uniref:tyrosine--tRNA ligase n=1 Tax=Ensete ventricosum TaxID=4639 RepID=A0A444DB80_ENSVE|nr:hypothetical protein B296_00057251 [Ensete ventricosum]RWV95357.1 hypothetical protein GW17_00042023 [Ensete ventricosum]RWW81244.1 hypothetical protein BHE74_00010372 [Ensete ventricosum]RZR97149.1 hypothetical protein BHM03_00026269 [Ensete ventricosum]
MMAGAPEAADPSRDVGTLSVDASPSVPPPAAAPWRFALVRSVGEECIQEGELMNLLVKKTVPDCYDGFEPSGRVHIVQAEVNVKIRKGYWPPKIVEGNPCLEDIKYIVFPWFGYFGVVPQVENGGTK